MENGIKKNHKIFTLALLIVAMALLIAYVLYKPSNGKEQILTCDGTKYYIQNKISIKYLDNNIEKVDYKMVYDLGVMDKEEFTELKEDIKKKIDLCQDTGDINNDFNISSCTQEIDGDVITADLILDIKPGKITDVTLDKMKEYLTEHEFTCMVEKPQ